MQDFVMFCDDDGVRAFPPGELRYTRGVAIHTGPSGAPVYSCLQIDAARVLAIAMKEFSVAEDPASVTLESDGALDVHAASAASCVVGTVYEYNFVGLFVCLSRRAGPLSE